MSEFCREDIKNIAQGEVVELKNQIAAIGCQTLVGCGKTKELETYINGKLKSDLTDLATAQKSAMGILEKMSKDISGMRSLIQFDESDLEKKVNMMGDKIKKDSITFTAWAIGIIITLLGAKLFQDWQNQNQTVGFLKPMMESVIVLQEHDKQFQEHIKTAQRLVDEKRHE
jgi:hypothetical protein